MSNKKCQKKNGSEGNASSKKFTCKKCGLTSGKQKKLCKPKPVED